MTVETQKVLLSSAGLQQVAMRVKENNFKFIVGGHEYPCHSFFADFISPNVAKLHLTDPLADTYTIKCKDLKHEFKIIMSLMNGEKIMISPEDRKYILKIAKKLGNGELFDRFAPNYEVEDENDIDFQLIISILDTKFQYDLDYQKEADFIAEHFHTIDHDLFRSMPIDVIERIMNSDKLLIDSELEIFNVISDLCKNAGPEYSRLFNNVIFENLDAQVVSNFMKDFGPDKLESSIWTVLCSRLSLQVPEANDFDRYKKTIYTFKYDTKKPFYGIFQYMRDQYQRNIESIVQVTALQDYNNTPAKKLINGDKNSSWGLSEIRDNYLLFDFKNVLVKIDGYEIHSSSNSHWDNPQSWVLEISKDNEHWTVIDQKNENTEMGGNEKHHYWEIEQKTLSIPSRYIRWRLTKTSGSGGLMCKQWEFYGDFIRPLNESDLE